LTDDSKVLQAEEAEEGGFAKEAAQVPYQGLGVVVCYYACSLWKLVKSERIDRSGT
jgi:hypothetical protein